jgi:hypothetical protein
LARSRRRPRCRKPPPVTSFAALTMCHPPHKWGRDKKESFARELRRSLHPSPFVGETSEARSWGGWPKASRVGWQRSAGWGLVQRSQNALHHPSEILINIGIPEPKNPEALSEEKCVTDLIGQRGPRQSVLTSIGFDHEPGTERNEVHNVATDRRLSPKLEPERLQLAQLRPQFYFLRRKTLAKRAGIFVCQDSDRPFL